MLGKKMNNKQTFESMKMDRHIIDNKTFEILKNRYIYDVGDKPIQLLYKQQEPFQRVESEFSNSIKRFISAKENHE
jgi:hypothetical protein